MLLFIFSRFVVDSVQINNSVDAARTDSAVKQLYSLKVRCAFFQKRFRKQVGGRVPKQTCSQSAVKGVSTHDARRERSSVHMTDISRAERRQKDRDGG